MQMQLPMHQQHLLLGKARRSFPPAGPVPPALLVGAGLLCQRNWLLSWRLSWLSC
jgi:hypothetical protein